MVACLGHVPLMAAFLLALAVVAELLLAMLLALSNRRVFFYH